MFLESAKVSVKTSGAWWVWSDSCVTWVQIYVHGSHDEHRRLAMIVSAAGGMILKTFNAQAFITHAVHIVAPDER